MRSNRPFLPATCCLVVLLGFVSNSWCQENPASANQWEANWPQIKIGMTQKEVLALLGTPSGKITQDTKITITSAPPPVRNPGQAHLGARHTVHGEVKYAIWSYYGAGTIQDADIKSSTVKVAGQTVSITEISKDSDGKLLGHAIKFDGTDRVVEVASQ